MSKHINANKEDIAKVVLMPGDPLRAKWIAETFLNDAKLVCSQRGNLGYTGYSKNGIKITVLSSGMGLSSAGIYSHELYKDFDVDLIIRVGTCGAYQPGIELRDVLVAQAASCDVEWNNQITLSGPYAAVSDYESLSIAVDYLKKNNIRHYVGNVLTSQHFYDSDPDIWKKWAKLNVLGVEMESYVVFTAAALLRKKALSLLTVTDLFLKEEYVSAEDRQSSLKEMIEAAIYVAEEFSK